MAVWGFGGVSVSVTSGGLGVTRGTFLLNQPILELKQHTNNVPTNFCAVWLCILCSEYRYVTPKRQLGGLLTFRFGHFWAYFVSVLTFFYFFALLKGCPGQLQGCLKVGACVCA